ncbi:amino acid adenylation domain-containing protein [Nostoc commune]|uniref:amino acid adenylation domain-containing protein n=1 Tax=Nostoc commune TaxID=1178 RepID=UPI0018C840A2|nr:non-ribosomal peptide synthetase [Nostoc commune]MBG1259151.1 amino acid adenylation domain-containing protein [Nostoc commune BAE]
MDLPNKFSTEQGKEKLWNAFRDVLSSSRKGSPLQQISREGNLQISFAQQRFWLLNQLEPDSCAYNEYVAFLRLKGSLNVVALEQSLNEIVRRHEVLRTTFLTTNGEPIQKISPYTPVKLALIDLQQFSLEQGEAEAQRQASEEIQQTFDLERGPLLRVKLWHLNKGEYIFLTTIHHIVYDGWSHGVFIQELSKLYKAFSHNNPSPLPDLTIQYADFAQWQRDRLQGKMLQSQIDYWKQQLSGTLPILHLPTDRPQPASHTSHGAYYSQILPKELIAALKSLSESEDATLFMVLLAAFKTLLYRYTEQEDILVGSPIANRNRFEISELIGCFVNTLVLRTDLSGNPTFKELLGRVREVALGAYAHQDLPFEKLVEELQPERDLSRSPLFQVMFVFHNTPGPSLKLEGLTLSPLPIENKTAKFNLTLSLEETAQGLIGVWEYNTDLFEASSIERMAKHFQILLEGIVAHPQQHICELPLLTPAEQHQLLVEWNDTQADYFLDRCIHELFEMQSFSTPDAVAVIFENQLLTYRELNERANKVAHYLKILGVEPDVLVGICVERSLEMVVGLLGILKAGGAYVPLDANYPQERLSYMLEDAAVSVLLTQQHLLESLPLHQADVVCLDSDWEVIRTQSPENLVSKVSANNLAYVIYTSGSTGKPKGIAMTHSSLVNLIVWQIENAIAKRCCKQFGDPKAKTLQFAPVSFDVSFQEIFSTWCIGGTLVLISEEIRQDAYALLRLIVEAEIERLFLPFVALQQLAQVADSSPLQPINLREIITAGEQLQITPTLIRFFNKLPGCVLQNHYGPSETHVVTSFTLQGSASGWQAMPPIGRPIANIQIYILDDNLQPVPIGVAGELYIGGAGVARGYLNRPDLTKEKFILNPFEEAGGSTSATLSDQEAGGRRLYKTGDLARYLANGNIQFLGRSDRQVKIRGFRIELGEIETVLSTHPQVRQAIVVAREDKPANKCLVAYLVSHQESLTSSQLRDFLKQKLPEYMIPSVFVMLEAMPLTPSGKVDRKALPAPDEELSRDNFVLPCTPTEEAIAHIFTSVLGVQQISIHDNFFEIGGHSLLATQVISRLRETFKAELPLRRLFQFPTVAQLSQTFLEFEQKNADILVKNPEEIEDLKFTITPTQRTSNQFPLSFTQERLWFLDQLEGKSYKYNIPIALQIQGNLNIAVLEQALVTITQRHGILRTRFPTTNGTPVQVIDPNSNLALTVVDLQEFSPDQRFQQVQQKVKQELETPFNLAKSQSLRVTLLQVAHQEFVLLVSMHHIVFDGWSVSIFTQELFTLYQAFLSNSSSPLPSLPIQYADFAVWQRQWWCEERLQTQLDYWKQQLSHAPPILELPSDRPRLSVQTFRGKSLSFQINPELNKQLQTLTKNTGATLFMTLLAAFATLLYRYSFQEDISIGSPIANRNRSEIEPLIGSFINTLVLRIRIQDNPSFAELLTQVQQVALDAYEHQDAPFEKVVEALQPERNLSHNSLFQVMFVLQNVPEQTFKLPNLSLTPFDLDNVTSKFDLTLSIAQKKQELQGRWEYNTDLFDEDTIIRMNEHFQTLLLGIVANPHLQVSKLPLLTATERQMLVDWNNTYREYPQDKCIHQLFELQVEKTPLAIAVVFEDQQLTYLELNKKANCLAHYLQKLGVGPEVVVGLCVERSTDMIVGLLGILKAGGAYVPLDPAYPQERLAFMLCDAAMPILLTQKHLIDKLPSHEAKVVSLDTDWESISRQSEENPTSLATADNLAYIIYTSGSTGKPKGVCALHRGVVRLVKSVDYAHLSSAEVFLQLAPISFDASTFEIWGSLLNGARLAIFVQDKPSLDELGQAIRRYQVTTLWLTAGLFHLMVEERLEDLKLLRQLLAGGDVLSVPHVLKFLSECGDCQLINGYGPTENTTFTCCYRIPEVVQPHKSISIGRPIANTQVYILDSHQQPVPINVLGELYIGGDGLTRGYLNQPQLTTEKFIPNPFDNSKCDRLYKTGDLARYLADGNIEFLGRLDNQVKIRGFRIELGEIENAIALHPSIQQTVVTARVDDSGDKRLVAYIVPHSEQIYTEQSRSTPTTDELRHFLKQKLPEYMVPSAFVFLDTLPLTPNGKIDRNALPSPNSTKLDSENTYVAPRDSLELQLTKIWEKVLSIQPIGIRDNFFSLGGHSLLAVRLFAQIEKALKKNLPLAILFQAPTIEKLATILSQSELSKSWSYLVPIQPLGSKPPLFIAHGLGGHGLSFVDLVSYLGSEQPVYGLQARGLDGKFAPLTRLEDMATNYICEIRTFQPKGPYFLAGHSFGGLLALEIAQQLYAQGEEVALLALFDSGGLYSPISFGNWLSVHLTNLSQIEFKEKLDYIWNRVSWHIKWMIPKPIRKIYTYLNHIDSSSQSLRHLSVLEANLQASKHYVMRPFPGIVTLFRASLKSPSGYSDPQAGWGKLALGGVEIHDVPGDHTTLLKEPNLQVLAEKLKACLNKAQSVDRKVLRSL